MYLEPTCGGRGEVESLVENRRLVVDPAKLHAPFCLVSRLHVRALLRGGITWHGARAGGDAGNVHEGAVFRTAVAEDVVAGVERKRPAVLEKARAEALTAATAEPVAGDEVGEGVESAERVVAEARRPETVMALRPSLDGIGTGHYHLFALGGLKRDRSVLASGVCGLHPLAVGAAAYRDGVASLRGVCRALDCTPWLRGGTVGRVAAVRCHEVFCCVCARAAERCRENRKSLHLDVPFHCSSTQ